MLPIEVGTVRRAVRLRPSRRSAWTARRAVPAALALLAALLAGASGLRAAAPTRPGAPVRVAQLATLRIDGRDYVRATEVAQWLRMRYRWEAADRTLVLFDGVHRIDFTPNSRFEGREILVDGLAVFLGDPVYLRSGQLYLSRIDLDHRLVPLVRPSWGGPPPPRPRLIVLDPGHGGDDSGAQNTRVHVMEKTETLDTARRLKRLLEADGYEVVMTRTGDYKLDHDHETDLRLRGEVAVARHADLFLSIHFNSVAPDARTHGTEVYIFCPAHQRSSDSWGRHEDDSEPNREYPEPSPINRLDHWNVVFAHAMHRELLRELGTEDRGEKLRHLGVLRGLNCPGILVESAFLSNDAEAMRVATPAFRERVAEGLLAGIRAYAAELESLRPRTGAAAGGYGSPSRP